MDQLKKTRTLTRSGCIRGHATEGPKGVCEGIGLITVTPKRRSDEGLKPERGLPAQGTFRGSAKHAIQAAAVSDR